MSAFGAMRELAKSVTSLSWAVSLLGLRELGKGMGEIRGRPPVEPPRRSLEAVTRAAQTELDGGFKRAFEAGDRLQRSVVDLAFGLGRRETRDARRLGDLATNVIQQSATFVRRFLP